MVLMLGKKGKRRGTDANGHQFKESYHTMNADEMNYRLAKKAMDKDTGDKIIAARTEKYKEKMLTKRQLGKYQTVSRSAAAGTAATSGNVALANETVDGGIGGGETPRPKGPDGTNPDGWKYEPNTYER